MISVWTAISMLVYALIMLKVHISIIGPDRDYIENLIPRYLIPWEVVVVFLFIHAFILTDKKATAKTYIIALALMFLISDSSVLLGDTFVKHKAREYNAFEEAGMTPPRWTMIYYVDEQYTYGYADREFFYSMFPARTNFVYQMFGGSLDELTISADEFSDILLSEYNFLYLQSYSDEFTGRYGSLFENEADIEPESVYSVTEQDGRALLIRIRAGE